jgi:hypothetical protein
MKNHIFKINKSSKKIIFLIAWLNLTVFSNTAIAVDCGPIQALCDVSQGVINTIVAGAEQTLQQAADATAKAAGFVDSAAADATSQVSGFANFAEAQAYGFATKAALEAEKDASETSGFVNAQAAAVISKTAGFASRAEAAAKGYTSQALLVDATVESVSQGFIDVATRDIAVKTSGYANYLDAQAKGYTNGLVFAANSVASQASGFVNLAEADIQSQAQGYINYGERLANQSILLSANEFQQLTSLANLAINNYLPIIIDSLKVATDVITQYADDIANVFEESCTSKESYSGLTKDTAQVAKTVTGFTSDQLQVVTRIISTLATGTPIDKQTFHDLKSLGQSSGVKMTDSHWGVFVSGGASISAFGVADVIGISLDSNNNIITYIASGAGVAVGSKDAGIEPEMKFGFSTGTGLNPSETSYITYGMEGSTASIATGLAWDIPVSTFQAADPIGSLTKFADFLCKAPSVEASIKIPFSITDAANGSLSFGSRTVLSSTNF